MNHPVKPQAGVTYNMVVGATIRTYREQAKLNQGGLASRLGLPASTLSRLEKGSYSCSVEQLAMIGQALGIPPAAILQRIDDSVSYARKQGLQVSHSKQDSDATPYILGAAAIAALVLAASR